MAEKLMGGRTDWEGAPLVMMDEETGENKGDTVG